MSDGATRFCCDLLTRLEQVLNRYNTILFAQLKGLSELMVQRWPTSGRVPGAAAAEKASGGRISTSGEASSRGVAAAVVVGAPRTPSISGACMSTLVGFGTGVAGDMVGVVAVGTVELLSDFEAALRARVKRETGEAAFLAMKRIEW